MTVGEHAEEVYSNLDFGCGCCGGSSHDETIRIVIAQIDKACQEEHDRIRIQHAEDILIAYEAGRTSVLEGK